MKHDVVRIEKVFEYLILQGKNQRIHPIMKLFPFSFSFSFFFFFFKYSFHFPWLLLYLRLLKDITRKPYWENSNASRFSIMEDLCRSIEMESATPLLRDHAIEVGGPSIFKIPYILLRHSPKSFIPNAFSIGPIHYKKEHLKETEETTGKIKRNYLNNLLNRKRTPQTTHEDFKRSILNVEDQARRSYDVTIDLSKDEFVDMLVLDGCFIIELLRNNEITSKQNDKDNSNNDDNNHLWGNILEKLGFGLSIKENSNSNTIPVEDGDVPVFISVGWVLQVLYHDLILLENQIPWFVLECLFEMTSKKESGTKSLTELALGFFGRIFSEWSLPSIPDGVKSNHIVDLLRNSFIFSFGKEKETTGKWKLIPTAASLKESGIMLKKGDSSKLLNINFDKKGVLKIPSLLIQEPTCVAFRNLISYEQCYPNCKPKITSYAIFLNNLISTTKDLNVFCEAGIIDNWLNPNDTLEFFSTIYTDTFVRNFYYLEICQQMNEYTNQWWPRTRAAYVRIFWDPIGSLSLFAAGFALILTLLQTLYTMKQYYNADTNMR